MDSELPAEEAIDRSMTLLEELDFLFKPFLRDMNAVIGSTIQYRHGRFRFTVRAGADGKFRILLGESDWERKFGKKFKEIAEKYNLQLEYEEWEGFYVLLPGRDKRPDSLNGVGWLKRAGHIWVEGRGKYKQSNPKQKKKSYESR